MGPWLSLGGDVLYVFGGCLAAFAVTLGHATPAEHYFSAILSLLPPEEESRKRKVIESARSGLLVQRNRLLIAVLLLLVAATVLKVAAQCMAQAS